MPRHTNQGSWTRLPWFRERDRDFRARSLNLSRSVDRADPASATIARTLSNSAPLGDTVTDAVPIPENLHRWAARYLAGSTWATDVSWPRSTSQVWRVEGKTAVYAKISPSRPALDREIRAYRYARTALPPGAAPRMIAYDVDKLTLLTSAVPGAVVRGLPLAGDDGLHVHRLAGSLVRRWHDHEDSASDSARVTISAAMAAQATERSRAVPPGDRAPPPQR